MKTIRKVFGIDLRTLALYRICLGLVIVADLINRASQLIPHYSDFGVMPRTEAIEFLSPWRLSIHLVNGSATFLAILFFIAGLFALSLVIGYRTRIATVVSWFLLLSLHNRNPLVLQGGDELLLLLLFWGMFLPIGARFSVDEAMNSSVEKAPNKYFSVATIALLVQCMSVYFFSAFFKTAPEWIPDGTAVYYTLHLENFATPLAYWFRQFETLLQALTYFVWGLELAGPLLMFSPVLFLPSRLLTMFLFISMHVGFVLLLNIGLFPIISITSLLAFTPTWVWEKISSLARTPDRLGVKMYYDRDCGFCKKTCLLIRTFLLLPETPIIPAQDVEEIHRVMVEHDSWVVVDHDGQQYVRWRAVALAFRRSAIFWPLGSLFDWGPMRIAGERIYGFVATNRHGFLGSLTAALLPYRPVRITLPAAVNVFVGFVMILVFSKNVMIMPKLQYQNPAQLERVITVLRLDQKWNMFAPRPYNTYGWYVIPGKLRDGTAVDVYNHTEGEPSWEKPRYIAQTYSDNRWRKYLQNLREEKFQRQLLNYGRYLCRRWNADAPHDKQLYTHSIYFNWQRVLLNYQKGKTKILLMWLHQCFGNEE